MNNIQKIKDIRCLINEHYSDKEPQSKECFNRYCDDIEEDLEVLYILKDYFQYTDFSGLWYIDLREDDFDLRSECTKEEWNNSPQRKIKRWLSKNG